MSYWVFRLYRLLGLWDILSLGSWFVLDLQVYWFLVILGLTLLGRGTFFRWLFHHEERGLEVPDFVTFPNS